MRRSPALSFLILIGVLILIALNNAQAERVGSAATPNHPLVVGYFPQWGIYSAHPFYLESLVANGSIKHLDQINFANGFVSNGRCSLGDVHADLDLSFDAQNSVNGVADDPAAPFRGTFHQLKLLKEMYPKVKILMSLQGKAEDFAFDAQPENREAFVASCIDTFIRGEFASGIHEPGLFDGFDIDWESPQAVDADNFRGLLVEFRRQMNAARRGLRLSIAVGQSPQMLPGTDFSEISSLVDQIGVMNYDYAGPWNKTTGFLAPLFGHAGTPEQADSIERSIASYRKAGVPTKKLLMGLPFYGYGWTDVGTGGNGLFQSGHGVHGDQPYSYIRSLGPTFSVYRDPRSRAPWRFDGQTFWTYEDPVSVRYKVSYASLQRLGGVMIWELSGDTPDSELLRTVYHAVHHPLKARAFSKSGAGTQFAKSGLRRARQGAARESSPAE